MLDNEFRELTAQADRGDKMAQYKVGLYLLSEKQSLYDDDAYNRGRRYLEQAAKQDYPEASFEYATLLVNDNNIVLAAEFFFKAGRAGHEKAQSQFQSSSVFYQTMIQRLNNTGPGFRYYTGDRDRLAYCLGQIHHCSDFPYVDPVKALEFYNMAIAINPHHLLTLNVFAQIYYLGQLGQMQDFKKAYELLVNLDRLTQMSDEHHIKAEVCYCLGTLYEEGKGTPKSRDLAIASYRKAVYRNHLEATYRLAVLYYQQFEHEIKQGFYDHNIIEAVRLFEQSGLNKQAYHYLGLIYYYQKNTVKTEHYFYLAAQMDLPEAAKDLGHLYKTGQYGEAKKKSAVVWYQKAAILGNAESQYLISNYLTEGVVLEKDLIKAFKWCLKAAEAKYPDAEEKLKTDPIFLHYHTLYRISDDNLEKLQQYLHLEEQLGYVFQETKHLLAVLDQRHDLREKESQFRRYQLMGDSVWEAICKTLLCSDEVDSGQQHDVSLPRQSLVSNAGILLRMAKNLNLHELIVSDTVSALAGITDEVLVNTMAALIGAIYFDEHMDAASEVVQRLWHNDVNELRLASFTESMPHHFFRPALFEENQSLLSSFDTNDSTLSQDKTYH